MSSTIFWHITLFKISIVSVVISHLSIYYFINLGFLFSSWCVCWAVSQFCLSFQKTGSWFYQSFLFFKSLFIPSLTFISFCWLWAFFVVFLIFLGGRLNYFEFFFFFFSRKAYIIVNFPLKTAFVASYSFCKVVFSLLFVSRYFLISSLISLLTHWFLNNMFSLHMSIFSFCGWLLISWRSFLKIWLSKRSATFQLVFCENCSTCRCIFDVFVGVGELHILLFCHLDPPPLPTS